MAMSTITAPGFIVFSIAARDQLRRGGAGHQHGADHQVGALTSSAIAARVE